MGGSSRNQGTVGAAIQTDAMGARLERAPREVSLDVFPVRSVEAPSDESEDHQEQQHRNANTNS
jgi:hypothetical protein